MNQEVKTKWLEALRSGKYQQGKRYLRMSYFTPEADRYCCLGVLCSVVDSSKWEHVRRAEAYGCRVEYDGHIDFLPAWLAEALDITQGEQEVLADRNDHGESFAQIAYYIEENL